MDKEINKLIWTLFVPHSLQDKRNIFFHFIRKKTISTQHALRHINFQFLWPGWHHPRPDDNLCPAQTRRTEGKPLLIILHELHVNRTFGKLLFQLWKWKQSCFSDQRYQVICLCFRFILLIESHGHSLLKVLEIKMHDLSVFEGLSDERNCGTQEIRWRKD